MKKALVLLLIFNFQFSIFNSLRAQDSANVRKGWTFGVLPSFAYDADLGLQLGLLSNVYYFGDGAVYPDYYHSFYVEAATTSKHYGLYRFAYDSKYLIPGHRLSIDLTYLPDQMCDFYGFNGYEARYLPDYSDQSSDLYRTRAYYKFKRDMFRFSADLQGTIAKPWYWNAGIGLLYYNVGTVDVARLNKYTKDEDAKLPEGVGPTGASIPTCMEGSPSTPATASRIPAKASMPTLSSPIMPAWAKCPNTTTSSSMPPGGTICPSSPTASPLPTAWVPS